MNFLLLKKSLISEVGILKAGILAYIYASISPKINSKDLIDGHPWCYDTYATLSNTFATSSSTIKRNINELVDGGYLLKAHHNSSKGDMTSYYTFTDASWSHYLSEKDDKKIKNTHEVKMSQCMRSKCTNALGQNEPMHEVKMTPSTIYTNTHTNTHTNTICENDNLANKGVLSNVSKKDDTLQGVAVKSSHNELKQPNSEVVDFVAFEKFWKLYPRRVAKPYALKAFGKLSKE